MKKILVLLLLVPFISISQNGAIQGKVQDVKGEPIPFANIYIEELEKGNVSDLDGNYRIDAIPVGVISIKISSVGFKTEYLTDVEIKPGRTLEFTHTLKVLSDTLQGVVVQSDPFVKKDDAPTGFRTLNSTEIERYPGANRDVSKVIQALPGVAQVASFRNDIIIRGGAPGENKFYLDDIEVPNINHFATQGASGGPVGLLNVNFIRNVDFYASSFPSNKANGLSSVLSFEQKKGNPDKLLGQVAVGSSDAGLTLDGPLGNKANFILSTRVSYLQLLFKALKLPFLPTYYDGQFKVTYQPTKKDRLTFIGLGAIDKFRINTSVNDGVDDEDQLKRNNYILAGIPSQNQWNYTVGVKYEHRSKNSRQLFIVSQNQLNNESIKYINNDDSDAANKVLDYSSSELENKFRFENLWNLKGWKIMVGAGYEWALYKNRTFNKISILGNPITIDFDSKLGIHKFAVFGQVTKSFFKDYLALTVGLRSDFSGYNKLMRNPLEQLSPNLGIGVKIYKTLKFNASAGVNHQLPAYTILGYRDFDNNLVNKDGLKYIRVYQYSGGFEYTGKWNGRFALEGFYKDYRNYPFSTTKGISLANLGADFGVIGNEAVTSTSAGRAYGLEFLYQQKMKAGFYGILSYTYVRSEFQNGTDAYTPSSWDSRNIISVSAGKRFKKGWELGIRWLFSGGAPFTPLNEELSSTIGIWETNPSGVLDYSQINAQRGSNFHQLDVRVDKKFSFKKWSLNIYLDIQNIYNYKTRSAPFLSVVRDANGDPVPDSNNPGQYEYEIIENTSGTILPTIGIIFDFPMSKGKTAETK